MKKMIQSMRWFGPDDQVSLDFIKQAGCAGVVTALHQIPNGETWPVEEIIRRKNEIESAGLNWEVVESVPVHENIKTRTGSYELQIENYKQTIRNLGQCGIKVITYNFMPVMDWTRTNLRLKLGDGSLALQFEKKALAAFDMFIMKRQNAGSDYSLQEIEAATDWYTATSEEQKSELQNNIIMGLPGSEESFTLDQFAEALQFYKNINSEKLRLHLIYFLQQIIPVAEESGIKMAVHPDDPPYPILGLPRIVSTAEDIDFLIKHVPSSCNGICFCTGSFGVRKDNNLPFMIRKYADRIYFLHLRNTIRNENGDFFESDHLEGDTDMYEVVKAVTEVMSARDCDIYMRPDHGHQMLDDIKNSNAPGYSAIGRLKGLAELRGLELAILRLMQYGN
jgi:mannonate dehydratase